LFIDVTLIIWRKVPIYDKILESQNRIQVQITRNAFKLITWIIFR